MKMKKPPLKRLARGMVGKTARWLRIARKKLLSARVVLLPAGVVLLPARVVLQLRMILNNGS